MISLDVARFFPAYVPSYVRVMLTSTSSSVRLLSLRILPIGSTGSFFRSDGFTLKLSSPMTISICWRLTIRVSDFPDFFPVNVTDNLMIKILSTCFARSFSNVPDPISARRVADRVVAEHRDPLS